MDCVSFGTLLILFQFYNLNYRQPIAKMMAGQISDSYVVDDICNMKPNTGPTTKIPHHLQKSIPGYPFFNRSVLLMRVNLG